MMNSLNQKVKEKVVFQISDCKVHLLDESESLELVSGKFNLVTFTSYNNNMIPPMIVKVGDDFQWPILKDQSVVKLTSFDYLFTIPVENDELLKYGVTFSDKEMKNLKQLDKILKINSSFSSLCEVSNEIDWKEFAPKSEEYNSFLAKAIAGGTGHIVKGIISCSNSYSNKVNKGGDVVTITKNVEEKNDDNNETKKNRINTNLHRVNKLSKATEKLSNMVLESEEMVTDLLMAPVVNSKMGKTLLSSAPGEIIMASLDAINTIQEVSEIAQTQVISATSKAVTRKICDKFGDNAGEATGEVLETATHMAQTAFNVQKALDPLSVMSSGILNID